MFLFAVPKKKSTKKTKKKNFLKLISKNININFFKLIKNDISN